MYEESAVMNARPFGTFTGTEEILAFWQKLIDDGFADVEYIEPTFGRFTKIINNIFDS